MMVQIIKTLKFAKWKLVLQVIAVLWLLFAITFNLQIVLANLNELGDFGSFIAAGESLRDGTNPYGATSPIIFEAQFPYVHTGGKLPNLNPPITAMVFTGIKNYDFIHSVNIWRGISLIMYIVAAGLLVIQYKPTFLKVIWVFSLAGLWHTIGLGQLYTLLLLLVTLTWLGIQKKKDLLAGISLGILISIKPNFLVWLILLVLISQWRVVTTSVVTILAIGVIPIITVGPNIYLEWLEAAGVGQAILAMPGNSSMTGLFSRFGYPLIGTVASVILLATTMLLLFFRRTSFSHDQAPIHSFGILLSLLASPIAWTGYTILTLPIFVSRKYWPVLFVISAFILSVPFNFTMHLYYLGSVHFIFWGWWYGISLVLLFSGELTKLVKRKGHAKVINQEY